MAAGKVAPPDQTVFQIVKELGVRGLYKGSVACLLRDMSFSGIYFPAYARVKKKIKEDNNG